MEISEVVNTQLAFPGLIVGLVLICAVLVFVFGFKSVEDFPFDKLATVADDRKPAGKKRKVKDKKSQSNGQATSISETKQKSSDNTGNKVTTNKVKPVEKSPAKDVSKTSSKQEKKLGKTDTSPSKIALKDTKNIKEPNKTSDDGQKPGKVKEVSGKQQKDTQLSKQTKSKGKENVEAKNKKNVEKSKNKSDEKPKDFDEGEWEQAFSRKDKKNRKPVISDDDNVAEKLVKTEVASPGKKKKIKSTAEVVPESLPTVPVATVSVEDEPQDSIKETKEKPAKKDKELKKEKPKQVDEAPVIENMVSIVDVDNDGKAAKKKKKKTVANKENLEIEATVSDEKSVTEETILSQVKTSEPIQNEEPQGTTGAVFDELGDTWKEAKIQKKASKKKVRKAE